MAYGDERDVVELPSVEAVARDDEHVGKAWESTMGRLRSRLRVALYITTQQPTVVELPYEPKDAPTDLPCAQMVAWPRHWRLR